jgi:hypothetical protein
MSDRDSSVLVVAGRAYDRLGLLPDLMLTVDLAFSAQFVTVGADLGGAEAD